MSFPNLDDYLPRKSTCTEVSLYGQRVAERYDDVALSFLADFPMLAKLELLNHHITRFPSGLHALKHAWIGQAPRLVTLAGIEDAAGLQALQLSSLPALDLADAFERLGTLAHLELLSLGGDQVRELPAACARLPSLTTVKLEYTPNLDLDQAFGVLAQIPTLRALELGKVVLPPSIGTLRGLRALHVVAQGSLPDELGQLVELEELHLPKATCKALPPTIGKLTKLTLLDLYYAKVTGLPEEIATCKSLRAIHARSSALATLPASIGRLGALRELDVYNTRLKKLPSSIGSLAQLRVLELSRDKPLEVPDELYQLSLETFTGPQEVLDRLVLRRLPTPDTYEALYSEPDRMPDDVGSVVSLQLCMPAHAAPIPQLARLARTEQVTIDTGNLGDAFTRLAAAERLWRLSIIGEHETLPASIGELVRLTTLEIDSGPWGDSDRPGVLRELPAELGKLVGLKKLTINRNRLTDLPASIGELAALEGLRLRVGELRALPASFGKLQRLVDLELHDVNELRLPDELASCAALASVTLHSAWESGALANVDVLGRFPSLRTLRLVGFKKLHDWVDLLTALAGSALEVLVLDDSNLGTLPAEIGGLGKLRRLALERTGITELPPELRRCTELRWLSWSSWQFSDAGQAAMKQQLPPGRWRKQRRDGVSFYERTA